MEYHAKDYPRSNDKKFINMYLVYVNPKYFRPAEIELLLGDPTRIEKELGWIREVSFEKLVDKMTQHDILALG